MTTTLKHLDSNQVPPSTKMSVSLTISPTMQTIIVDSVPMIDPQFTSIVGIKTETVVTRLEESHATCPTYSKVITSVKTRPAATRVPVVDILAPTSHVWFSTIEVLAPTTLTKIKCILSEQTMAVDDAMFMGLAAC
jgi:hypothetical protein